MINTELPLAAWLEKLQKKWDTEEYCYDVEEAKKVFKFVSKLTNDRGASRNFDLLEFQFEIITEILCVKRRSDGKRKHREAHINIPRKNGKSFLAAISVFVLLPAAYLRRAFYFNGKYNQTGGRAVRNGRTFHKSK